MSHHKMPKLQVEGLERAASWITEAAEGILNDADADAIDGYAAALMLETARYMRQEIDEDDEDDDDDDDDEDERGAC